MRWWKRGDAERRSRASDDRRLRANDDRRLRAGATSRRTHYATSPLLASKTPPWRSKLVIALVGCGFAVLRRPRGLHPDHRHRLLL